MSSAIGYFYSSLLKPASKLKKDSAKNGKPSQQQNSPSKLTQPSKITSYPIP